MKNCLHCGAGVKSTAVIGGEFCCLPCKKAYGLIEEMGLGSYYQRRTLNSDAVRLHPENKIISDCSTHVLDDGDGTYLLHLMVEGLQCAACVWLIESVLRRQTGVIQARLNMSSHRLALKWRGDKASVSKILHVIAALGYRLVPYDSALLESAGKKHEKELLRALAVAGFGAANVMLLSISVWAGYGEDMGLATRGFLYWLSAFIALPAIAYAGIPFFRSAWDGLKHWRLNIDAPISMAIIMAPGMSLYEVIVGGKDVYFDSAITLLFFLLLARYLDCRARGVARSGAEQLLGLGATAVAVLDDVTGKCVMTLPSGVARGASVLVAAGERIGVDGIVIDGTSDVDVSPVNGESMPQALRPGGQVFAGTINLSNPLTIKVMAVGDDTLLSEVVHIMKAAEQGKSRYVVIADRIARYYGPLVHVVALLAFFGWLMVPGVDWHQAAVIAMSVIIITCPCALGLAAPAVQVIASGRLFKSGVLLKTGTALERLAEVDTVVFDKTGTLTTGHLELKNSDSIDAHVLALAASISAASRHPLARSLNRVAPPTNIASSVHEEPGKGLAMQTPKGEVRLGSREWCGVCGEGGKNPELWLSRPEEPPVCFVFEDRLRSDAVQVVAELKSLGYEVEMISGDQHGAAAAVGESLNLTNWQAGLSPKDKSQYLQALDASGRRVLMAGDGLNDAPALGVAHASISPSTAMDISQMASDVVFQGERLAPLLETLDTARRAASLVRQNVALALLYNGVTMPLAISGMVTPLIAAIAMSVSSLVVVGNALRLNKG